MAKKVKAKKVHEHTWSVGTESEAYHECLCDDECNCSPLEYAIAECTCGMRLDSYEIEEILNKFATKI